MVRAVVLALCLVASTAFVPATVKKQALAPNKMSDDAAAEEPPAAPAADPAPMASMPEPAAAPAVAQVSDDERIARIVALPGMSTKADLVQIQKELCPAVPYWDPLQLADQTFWSEPNEATIGFLRQAEIKHGRVAMAGFVGFCVHANGWRWPAPMTLDGQPFPSIKDCSSPVELWDKIPEAAKWQIILFVGALEWYDEYQFEAEDGKPKHYMRGGIPGKYPAFGGLPLNLYDPFKLFGRMTEEEKARGRLKEINNGRLAMIGMMGFVAEAKVPGSVPSLKGLVGEYKGNIMVPFETDFTLFGDTAEKIASISN